VPSRSTLGEGRVDIAALAVTHPRWEPCAGIPLARI
jgi:hypothetical protein